MKNAKTVEVVLDGKIITFETGLLAKQANGAVQCQMGDTSVFSAVTGSKVPRPGIDFFPLQVEYREKFYAAGRFPGGYFKRESRPSEREILIARLTDRPIRPLFQEGFYNEVQIINNLMCADGKNESDILSVNAASAALVLSDLPFYGPIGAVRVGRIAGKFILNPTHDEIAASDINLIYVGTRDLPVMIEGNANEASEADLLNAMRLAHESVIKIVDAQLELRKIMGLPDKKIEDKPIAKNLVDKARELAGDELASTLMIPGKAERQDKVTAIKTALQPKMMEAFPELTPELFSQVFDALEIEKVRYNVLEKHHRIDGRKFDEIRPLDGQVGLYARTHGSALFSRGETQAMAITTLGTSSDVQEMDGIIGGAVEKRFLLHYNFPHYSVGEVGRLGSTGRREIGHGNLAERSILPVIPTDYPYTVRVVSEVMESNGSTSMATVCAGTLALMDAGVPLRKPVAGISVGLFTGGNKAELVIDILGAEDHCGDMDFKVAGTRDGITGFQVDLKIRGLAWNLVEGAFAMACKARMQILDFMATVLEQPRADISGYAPRIHTIKINPEKIGALIGPGGKMIRRITELTGAQIDINDDGTVKIFCTDKEALEAAIREVNLVTAEAEVGKIYRGKVTGVKDFGAFVEILPGKEGLVHISEMANSRVNRVEDICKMGDEMWVKCLNVDESGKVRLSRKAALEEMDKK